MTGPDCAQDRRDLWAAINEQRRAATRIEVALAEIKAMLTERCAVCLKTQGEHGERLTALEGAENKRKGGMAVLLGASSAAGAVAAVIIKAVWR